MKPSLAAALLASGILHASAAPGSSAIDWASLHCPPSSSATLPTPTYGSDGGLFTVCTELLIHAPASAVYNALLDFQAYSSFSTFVIDVQLPPYITKTPDDVYVGMPMTFITKDIFPVFNTTSKEIITTTKDAGDDGYLMNSWRYDDSLGGTFSRSEHPNVLVEQGDGFTRYLSFETFYKDPGSYLLLPLRKKLQDGFERHGQELKDYVESLEASK
ncbi:hypothetical protein LIA77_03270 [Sarocladium implicatum]|nr:hypothetical protein LIA77_03270 [Sarocladium implicatum]